jgi:phenylalanyl-tRNA synthetase beta chain
LRDVLTAAGFNEAMTLSAVEPSWAEIQSPWSTAAPLCCQPPVLKRADRLRQSLIPSLLAVRRTNESLANPWIEIFEMARIYLPHGAGQVEEEEMVAFVSGRDFFFVKGVLETLAQRLAPDWELRVAPIEHELLDPGQSIALLDGQEIVAYVGQVHERGRDRFELKQPVAVAEMKLSPLLRTAQLIRRFAPLSPYPAVTRDLNVIFDEGIHWADVERIVRSQSGPHLERIEYQETYRDRQRTGAGKKSILFSVTLRSRDGTLTREEADAVCHAITAQLHIELGGELRT